MCVDYYFKPTIKYIRVDINFDKFILSNWTRLNLEHMNLSEFVKKLKDFEESSNVIIKYKDRNYYLELVDYHDEYPNFFHSYRGYYEDIAIAIGKK